MPKAAVRKIVRMVTLVAAAIALESGVAAADFLGLTLGDYAVTLIGSSAVCGGADCAGTVHVPATNSNLAADFDWSFTIGAQEFEWTAPSVHTAISPNGSNSCAIEGGGQAVLCAVTDSGLGLTLNEAPFLLLFDVGGAQQYSVLLAGEASARGNFLATPLARVPEPSTTLLLASALTLAMTWAGSHWSARRRGLH